MDALVVGAGVVGLAVARSLAQRGHAVVIAEAAASIGSGISSRNSEVIHAGLYYPTGSRRAEHCVAGRHRLVAFCDAHHVPRRTPGKLIVATSAAEVDALAGLLAQGTANGVGGLALLDSREAHRREPALLCHAALLSAETGIVDSHAMMLALRGDVEDAGGLVALHTPVEALERWGSGWRARFGGREPGTIAIDAVVNCAALGAQALARRTDGYPPARVPRLVLAKGSYFACRKPSPFAHLIYPAPVEGGLGIHGTLDMAGRLRFGPDVEWVEAVDFAVDPARVPLFGTAIRRYWPTLRDDDLVPDYAGLRPKLTGPGEVAADFMLDGPSDHGLPGLVHLFGIESPGLTACLSLAEEVADAIGA